MTKQFIIAFIPIYLFNLKIKFSLPKNLRFSHCEAILIFTITTETSPHACMHAKGNQKKKLTKNKKKPKRKNSTNYQ